MAPKGTMAPTEMSSSPAIISRPKGMAITPRLAATFSQEAMPAGFRNVMPPKMAKNDQHGDKAKGGPGFGAAQQAAGGEGCAHGVYPFECQGNGAVPGNL